MTPLETRPRTVALVALGPSKQDFLNSVAAKKDAQRFDEVWTVNTLAGALKAHKCFVMDDLREQSSRYPAWLDHLKGLSEPIITCRAYPEWPTAIEYPYDQVFETFNDDWFTNTVAYAVAYAILIGVVDLYLFGCDFFYPGSPAVEPGADCVAYWLGRARERGVRYRIPGSSTLLDSHITSLDEASGKLRRPLYGYHFNPGRAREKVQRGTATPLDAKLADKAPTTYGVTP